MGFNHSSTSRSWKNLVLKVPIREALHDMIPSFPSSCCRWKVVPLNKQLINQMTRAVNYSFFQNRYRFQDHYVGGVHKMHLGDLVFRSVDAFPKKGYVENKVNTGRVRQIQLVSHLPHTVENLEGSKESSTKLVMSLEAHGVLAKRLEFDLNPFSFQRNHLLAVCVSTRFIQAYALDKFCRKRVSMASLLSINSSTKGLPTIPLMYLAIVGSFRP